MDSSRAIGIDFGTTSSSASVYKNGINYKIPNRDYGDPSTPSIVFYDPAGSDVFVGKSADQWRTEDTANLIYDVKRLLGRKYDDIHVQNFITERECRYKIVRGQDGNAEIEIKQNNKLVNKTPEEVLSEILKYLKDSATHFLGFEVTEAVMGVPGSFDIAQRDALKRAAELAGLNKIILRFEHMLLHSGSKFGYQNVADDQMMDIV